MGDSIDSSQPIYQRVHPFKGSPVVHHYKGEDTVGGRSSFCNTLQHSEICGIQSRACVDRQWHIHHYIRKCHEALV